MDPNNSSGNFDNELNLNLCGLSLHILFRSENLYSGAKNLFSGFEASDRSHDNPEYVLRIRDSQDDEPFPKRERTHVDVRYREKEGIYSVRHTDTVFEVSRTPSRVTEILIRRNHIAVENAIRIFLSMILPVHSTYLFHAASIRVANNRAVLFPGQSGAGKTTLSRCFGFERTMSDELSCLHIRESSQTLLHATPFLGDMKRSGETRSLKTAGILFLSGATDRRVIEPISTTDALHRLFSCMFSLRNSSHDVQKTLDRLIHILKRLPAGILHYSPEESREEIADRVESHLDG